MVKTFFEVDIANLYVDISDEQQHSSRTELLDVASMFGVESGAASSQTPVRWNQSWKQ